MTSRLIAALILLLPTTGLFAHAGHGHYPASQFWHYITAPEHLVQTLLVAGAVVALFVFLSVRSVKRNALK